MLAQLTADENVLASKYKSWEANTVIRLYKVKTHSTFHPDNFMPGGNVSIQEVAWLKFGYITEDWLNGI